MSMNLAFFVLVNFCLGKVDWKLTEHTKKLLHGRTHTTWVIHDTIHLHWHMYWITEVDHTLCRQWILQNKYCRFITSRERYLHYLLANHLKLNRWSEMSFPKSKTVMLLIVINNLPPTSTWHTPLLEVIYELKLTVWSNKNENNCFTTNSIRPCCREQSWYLLSCVLGKCCKITHFFQQLSYFRYLL